MSRTINKVTLLGRIGTDPEMIYTPRRHRGHQAAAGDGPLPQGRRAGDGLGTT